MNQGQECTSDIEQQVSPVGARSLVDDAGSSP